MSHSDTSSINVRNGGARLRRACLLTAALGALVTFQAIAVPPSRNIEECLETGTDLVSLPGVPGGTVSAKGCSTCETLRLTFDQKTRYFIDNEAVTYTRLLAASRKGPTGIYVFYRPETRVLTRVRLVASADAIKQ